MVARWRSQVYSAILRTSSSSTAPTGRSLETNSSNKRSKAFWSSQGRTLKRPARPCQRRFWEEIALPASDCGPELFCALARLAASCFCVTVFLNVLIAFAHEFQGTAVRDEGGF